MINRVDEPQKVFGLDPRPGEVLEFRLKKKEKKKDPGFHTGCVQGRRVLLTSVYNNLFCTDLNTPLCSTIPPDSPALSRRRRPLSDFGIPA